MYNTVADEHYNAMYVSHYTVTGVRIDTACYAVRNHVGLLINSEVNADMFATVGSLDAWNGYYTLAQQL